MIKFWLSAPVVALMSAATLLPVWSHFMPEIEGRYFPVTSVPWGIQELEPAPDGKTRFYQHFRKLRNCEFVSVNWRHRDTMVRVNVNPETSYTVQTLGVGEHVTGPWVIDGAPLGKLDAQTVHRCHIFWQTISNVYP